ncbi:MAG: radical SAM protein [Bacteroidota bacterium]
MYLEPLNIENLLNQSTFSKDDITYLLNIKEESDKNLLLQRSKQLEEKYSLTSVNSYGLIEISTHCSENCTYCRLRKDNKEILRERMNRERIIEIAKEINKSGIKSIVIRSGYDDFYDQDRIAYIIYSIKKHADVEIMLSFGERTYEEYKEWKIAGASGYRLRFKSSNQDIYNSLNAHGSFEERIKHIDQLKMLGYQVCSGSIIGLPEQTDMDIANDICLCKHLNLDIAEFLPFSSQNNTPLQNNKPCSEEKTKCITAVVRIVLKDIVRCSKPKYSYSLENDIVS